MPSCARKCLQADESNQEGSKDRRPTLSTSCKGCKFDSSGGDSNCPLFRTHGAWFTPICLSCYLAWCVELTKAVGVCLVCSTSFTTQFSVNILRISTRNSCKPTTRTRQPCLCSPQRSRSSHESLRSTLAWSSIGVFLVT